MKKLLSMLLAMVMVFALAACGGTSSSAAPSSTPAESADAGSGEEAPAAVEWTKNVEVQVPASAGGGTDVMARTLGQYVAQASSSNLTIVNNTDGGGVVAFENVRNAKTDGSTIMQFHTTMLIKTASGVYDKYAADDFKVLFVSMGTEKAGYVLLVSADYEVQTLEDLIALAKSKPGELMLGVETGGSSHIMAGLFAKAAGIELKFVEAGPDTEKLTALVGGSIDMCLVNPNQAKQYVESGKATPLAVVPRDEEGARGSVLPDVPSFIEQGVDFSFGTYNFVLGPKDMDEALAKQIYEYYAAAAQADSVNEVLQPAGFAMEAFSYEEGPQKIREQQEVLNAVVAELGLQQ